MKGPQAFRSISEAADAVGAPQHMLRTWESRFPFLKPVRRPDGRRYYRPEDIAILAEIARLSREERRSADEILLLHHEGRFRPSSGDSRAALERALADLLATRARLQAALAAR